MTMTNKVFSAYFLFFIIFPNSESFTDRGPKMRIMTRQAEPDTLMLPSNATSIRENISDNFSCTEKSYGYYADIDNDCQIFHVCLPVVFPDGKNATYRWSFICPGETIFDQQVFVCVREEDSSIDCKDSEEYYTLNDNFGGRDPEEDTSEGEGNSENSDDKMESDNMEMENAENENTKKKKPYMQKPESNSADSRKPEEQKKKNERRKPKM